MRKNKARKLTVLLAATLVAAAFGMLSYEVRAEAAPDTLFACTGMTAVADRAVPENLGYDTGRTGVLLSADKAGATAVFGRTMRGVFEMDFRVYSDATFEGAWSQADYTNPALDLRTLTITFRDTNSNASFAVIVTGGERYNLVTPVARVQIGTASAGLHYDYGASAPNDTANKNKAGYYTRLWGSSFCNYGRTGSGETKQPYPTVIGFDPVTKEVYGYQYYNGTAEKRLILDLSDPTYIGAANVITDGFDNYEVTVEMTEITAGRTGKLLVYSVNGQSLGGTVFERTAGPSAYTEKVYDGVAGRVYALPVASMYDVYTGTSGDFTGTVTVTDPKGVETTVTGDTFTPILPGTHIVTYLAEADGMSGLPYVFDVTIYTQPPAVTLEIDRSSFFEAGEWRLGVGGTLIFPAARASTVLGAPGHESLPVTVLLNGEPMPDLNAAEGFSYTFAEAGTVTVTYEAVDYAGTKASVSCLFTVETAPIFDVTALAELQYLRDWNDTYTVPEVPAILDGETFVTTAVTEFPDGSTTAETEFKLTQIGRYRTIYTCTYQAAAYRYIYDFEAVFGSERLFVTDANSTAESRSSPAYMNEYAGIKITGTADRTAVQFNNVIDLSEPVMHKLIELIVTPDRQDKGEFEQLCITLTDTTDPSCWLTVSLYRDTWGYEYLTRVTVTSSANPYYMGYQYAQRQYYSSNRNGTEIRHTFDGSFDNAPISVYYHAGENAIYASPANSGGGIVRVLPLDDINVVGADRAFGGFPSGTVTMTLTMYGLTQERASYLVLEAGGEKVSDTYFVDAQPPVIRVDLNGNTLEAVPVAELGRAYPVFEATCIDNLIGAMEPTVELLYGGRSLGEMQPGGFFIPRTTGEYVLRYTATDAANNTVCVDISVTVVEQVPDVTLDFAGTLVSDCEVGRQLTLPEPAVSGGSGVKTITAQVVHGSVVVSEEGGTFTPTTAGEYRILYTVRDWLGSYRFFYPLKADYSAVPVVREPYVPTVALNGVPFVLPALDASVYDAAGRHDAYIDVSVTYRGETVRPETFEFTPQAEAGETFTVTYTAKNDVDAVEAWTKSYEVTVLEPENNIGYFDLNYVTPEPKSTSTVFATETDGATMTFVNRLYAPSFEIQFLIPEGYGNFDGLEITLYDAVYADNFVSLMFERGETDPAETYLSVNGGTAQRVAGSFDSQIMPFDFGYDARSLCVYDVDGATFAVKNTLSGDAFKGFANNWVYLTVRFVGVDGKAGMELLRLGNQTIVDSSRDSVMPLIYVAEAMATSVEFGSEFVVSAAVGSDILSLPVTTTVRVIAPDGTVVLEESPSDVSYRLTASQYGSWSIEYTATDAAGRRTSQSHELYVMDHIAPVIQVDGTVPVTCQLGGSLTLPAASATDNTTQNVRVYVFSVGSDGAVRNVTDNIFTPTEAGVYTIRYFAVDDDYNYAAVDFVVTVQ